MKFIDKDLKAVHEARILMEEAAEAKKALALFEQKKLDCIIERMLDAIQPKLERLTEELVRETGYGVAKDELLQCNLLIERMRYTLKDMQCVGILGQDEETGIVEIGVPLGVIAVTAPCISAVSAVLCSAVTAIKAGNAVVFAPHPRAAKTTVRTVGILQEAAFAAGLPQGGLSCIDTAAKEGAFQLFCYPETALILNLGEQKLLETSFANGRPVICGGIAPSPVFIEKTADIHQAVEDIIHSRSFNYGIGAASEQYVVADRQIAEQAKAEMLRCGAYFMTQEEQNKLTILLGLEHRGETGDKECIGKTAQWLAAKAGFSVPESTKVLVSEQAYITDYNPYAKSLLCPVLVFYIEEDWLHACEKCIELLMKDSHGNTLAIHSKDPQVIRQFALKKPVGRVLINTPAVMGAMGVTTELYPTVILGRLTSKEGITAENVSPKHLTYRRKAAFGIRGFCW